MASVQITTVLILVTAFKIDFIDAFRQDYLYINATNAWYKYHTERATWYMARDACLAEGALLFYPADEHEYGQVKDGLRFPLPHYHLHVGFSDLMERYHYETVDGRPLEEVFHKWLARDPEEGSSQGYRCGSFHVDSLKVFLYSCDYPRNFICKATVDSVACALEDAKQTIANLTANVADLEKELANRTAVCDAVEREAQAQVTTIQAANKTATNVN